MVDSVDLAGLSVPDARLAREVLWDCSRGMTHNESAERLGIYPEHAYNLLTHVQAAIRRTSLDDQRHDMVTKLLQAEQTLVELMNSRYVKTSASGHVVMRKTGRTVVNQDGQAEPEWEEVEDAAPRIQAAAALAKVVTARSKLMGAELAPPALPPAESSYRRSIEDEIAALAAELGMGD